MGDVRGVGLLAALEFVADKKAKQRFATTQGIGAKVSAACLQEGLIARAMPHGDILGLAPPLIITRDEVDLVVSMVKRAVDQVYSSL